MARVLFVNPIVREEDVPRHIPMGIALLAAISIREGHKVAVFDANAWRVGMDKLADACKAAEWDVIAIGGLTTTYNYIRRAVKVIKQAAPKSLLVAGGGFLTSMPREMMGWLPQIDLGVVGEAFRTWPEVLRMVDEGERDFSQTLGVVWRDREGAVLNDTRPVIHDLDELPFPAWNLFPLEEVYFQNSQALFSEEIYGCKRRIDINASYGCSLICRYCWHLGTTGDMLIEPDAEGKNDVVFTYGRNIRYHSPAYIGDMVERLQHDYGVDFCTFLDENLMTMDSSSRYKWLPAVCEEWGKRGLSPDAEGRGGVKWAGTSHASLYRTSTLDLMKRAGCSHLVYGLESFDPHILKRLGKGTTRENNIQAVRDTQASGIAPIPNIIIGFPEESFGSVRNTINGLLELGIHAKPHFATAYPGSEWYYTYKESIIEQYGGNLEGYISDLGDATKITATISERFTGIELVGLQEIVAQRSLRLLDQAEKDYPRRDPLRKTADAPNFIGKRKPGPIEAIKVVTA